jgi:hypothetical protein
MPQPRGICRCRLDRPGRKAPLSRRLAARLLVVSLLYQKGRDSRIFQAQDRAIDDFTLKGKPRNGSIDQFQFYLLIFLLPHCSCLVVCRKLPEAELRDACGMGAKLVQAEARFAGYITRDDCSAPVRGADPLRRNERTHSDQQVAQIVGRISGLADDAALKGRQRGLELYRAALSSTPPRKGMQPRQFAGQQRARRW